MSMKFQEKSSNQRKKIISILNVCVNVGKRGLDERLTTTQIFLQQQEEAVRRGDRERRALTDRVKDLERALQASDMDKKHTPCTVLSRAQR